MVQIREEESNNLSDQDSPSPIHLEYNFIINRNSLEDKFFKKKNEDDEGGWRLDDGEGRKEENEGSREEGVGKRKEEEGVRREKAGGIIDKGVRIEEEEGKMEEGVRKEDGGRREEEEEKRENRKSCKKYSSNYFMDKKRMGFPTLMQKEREGGGGEGVYENNILNELDNIEKQKQFKSKIEKFAILFNEKPSQGIDYLINMKLVKFIYNPSSYFSLRSLTLLKTLHQPCSPMKASTKKSLAPSFPHLPHQIS